MTERFSIRRRKERKSNKIAFLPPQNASLKFIFSFFPDIEVANRHGHTCLMIACYKGHFRIARFVNCARRFFYFLVLCVFVFSSCRYLIDIGADVNRKSVKGNTALHDCAESGSLEIMKLLLRSGAGMDVDAYGERDEKIMIAQRCVAFSYPTYNNFILAPRKSLSEIRVPYLNTLSRVSLGTELLP